MVSFKSNLFSKTSYMYGLFCAIYQTKRAYRTSFYCRFSAYLFHKNVFLSNTLLNEQVLTFEESGLADYMSRRLYGWPTANFRSFSKKQPS